MRKHPPLRPRAIKPVTRDSKATYFQMHVYDQERVRLEAERAEMLKRLNIIEERVKFIGSELVKLGKILQEKRKN